MNRGAIATLKALEARGLSINQGAELVGSDPGTFSKILREKDGRKPGRTLSSTIFEKLGISTSLWDEGVDSDQPADEPDTSRLGG